MKDIKEKKKFEPKYKEGTVNGMKFESKHDDDYDDEELQFNEKKGISNKTLIKIALLCIVAIILFSVFFVIIKNSINFNGVYYETPSEDEVIEVVVDPESEEQEQVNLKLKGELVIEIEKGTEWEDPGYEAISSIDGDISDYVKVTGEVDTSKVGTYELVYELEYKVIAPKLTRLVKVVGKEEEKEPEKTPGGGNKTPKPSSKPAVTPQKPSTITLSLIGQDTVYLITGSSYSDAGASAVDNLGNNVSNQITKSGNVNTKVAGTYKITYSINNYNGQVLTVVRNVVVQSMEIGLSSRIDGSRAIISVSTTVDNFSHISLPDGTTTKNQNYSYSVTKNGTYRFVVYNNNGNSRSATISVNNIPTAPSRPLSSCSLSTNAQGKIVINVGYNSAVQYYKYNGSSFTSSLTTNINKTSCVGSLRVVAVYNDGDERTVTCTCP